MTAKFLAIVIAVVIWIVGAAPVPVAQPDTYVVPTPPPSPAASEGRSTPTPKSFPTSYSQPAAPDWAYPNSTQLAPGKWQSSADPRVITNWYKSKIEGLGMNAKSFVQTNTNGNVLNKLVAANGSSKVSVEISKSAADIQTSISVVLDN